MTPEKNNLCLLQKKYNGDMTVFVAGNNMDGYKSDDRFYETFVCGWRLKELKSQSFLARFLDKLLS